MNGESRLTHINVRLSQRERKVIEAKAARFSMAPSSFMRAAALLADERPTRVASAEELARIRVDLKRIGANLNQAARVLNTYGVDGQSLADLQLATGQVARAASALSTLLAREER